MNRRPSMYLDRTLDSEAPTKKEHFGLLGKMCPQSVLQSGFMIIYAIPYFFIDGRVH